MVDFIYNKIEQVRSIEFRSYCKFQLHWVTYQKLSYLHRNIDTNVL